LLFNGKVFTGDAAGTIAQAVAVDGERIVAVGTDAEVRGRYTGTKEIDLHGRLVTAGFNDAHIHFMNGGRSWLLVDLRDATSIAEVQRRVAAKAATVQPGEWIIGRGWDHTSWGGNWPTAEDLDKAAPNNPVALTRVDGHVLWVNSMAIGKAGVNRATPAPAGGEIMHTGQSDPSGIFKETAQGLIAAAIPAPTTVEQTRYVERALEEARRYGITSIQDNSGYETTKIYAELLRQHRLTVRVAEWQAFDDSIDEIKRQRGEFAGTKIDPFRIRLTSLKGYVDGTLGSRTAAMLEPFSDDPHNSGIPRKSPEELTRMIVERDAAGFQICLHAIGDRANRMALDGFEAAEDRREAKAPNGGLWEEVSTVRIASFGSVSGESRDPIVPVQASKINPSRMYSGPPQTTTQSTQSKPLSGDDLQPNFSPYTGQLMSKDGQHLYTIASARHRIEHAQVIAPSDFARFRDLGVIASMQPSHAISDKRWAQDRLGEYRVQGAYAWHMMRSFGVHVPFGTDWPVEPINPYLGLYAAITRMSTDGEPAGGWWPQERITIADAIRCYTAEPAYADFEEKDKGQIAVGMLADLTVHSQDLLTIEPAAILKTEAVLTILGGDVVYEKK
jgi:predicted amidohydrolase YtcJ